MLRKPQISEDNFCGRERKIGRRSQKPEQTGLLAVGHKITLALALACWCPEIETASVSVMF
jgi:hypothetical protein